MLSKGWLSSLRLDSQGVSRALGDLETEIMEVMWRHGEDASIRDVCERLGRPLSFNTVMTVMNNLAAKGLLIRSGRRRSYRYRAAVDRQQFASGLVTRVFRDLLADFGDVATAGFVEATDVMDEERLSELLAHLKARLSNTRAEHEDDA